MKKFIQVIILLSIMMVCGFGCTKIDKGYEGAKINTLGTDKGGVKILETGRVFYNPLKYDVITNPLFIQEYVWTASSDEGSETDESITFQSSNSLEFRADVGISFCMKKGQTGILYENYHKTVKQMIDTNLRNSVRDAFNRLGSKRDAEAIYGSGKAEFIKSIEQDVREFWKESLDIKKVYLIGSLNPPEQVKNAIAKKIEATQKAAQRRNEVEQSKAEADKKIEEARGAAESAKLAADARAYQISTEAQAEAKGIELINTQLSKSKDYVEYVKAQKWDGKLPGFVGGNSPVPMINVK